MSDETQATVEIQDLADDSVSITIDGREVRVPKGELLIKAAQDHGVYIPRFCYHERLAPVGMCRMCLVEVEGVRGLPPACTTPVTDGMIVSTSSPTVKKAQDGVLEFLLINHPLDCPVCDRGGECPLQDQTLAFGPGESRFVEEKRHFAKPIPLNDLVYLDRERCIQCARCTRFADEIAGEPLINFVERGGSMQVLTFPDHPFASYFSGNTVQICPVGALTARPYRFRARPWDLETSESTCQTCAVGCRVAVQSSVGKIVRILGVDSEPVNHGWLCDKGRFGIEAISHEDRVTRPQILWDGRALDSSWPDALEFAAEGLRRVIEEHGIDSVAVLGGSRGTNEDAYQWCRFAKGVLGTDNVDCQMGDGLTADLVLGLPRATIADCDNAAAIILLAPDLVEELPVLYLRLRRAAIELGVPIIDISGRDHSLSKQVAACLRHEPGGASSAAEALVRAWNDPETASDPELRRALEKIRERDGDVVVVLGRSSLAESEGATVTAAGALSSIPGTRFLSALRRSNVHGALDMGLAPGFLPGRVSLEAGRAWFGSEWGLLPQNRGMGAAEILTAASYGTIRALILLGADPVADFPDRTVATDAMNTVDFLVVVDGFQGVSTRRPDVFLPVAQWGEQLGSTTNIEGRVQTMIPRVTPGGTSMEGWRIASELALRFEVEAAANNVTELQDEISRVVPTHRRVGATVLAESVDGVVVPRRDLDEDTLLPAHRWDPAGVVVAAQSFAPPRIEGSLRLLSGRKLYDEGRVAVRSASLAGLADGPFVAIHPTEAERRGLSNEAMVSIRSSRGLVKLPLRTEVGIPLGVAWVPFNQPGPDAADLIDASQSVTDITIESA